MKEKYIKSPLNYVGGKYKLLKEILPLFPNDIDVFVDLFGGGFNVGINTTANKVVYNDLENHVVELLKYLKDNYGIQYFNCGLAEGSLKSFKQHFPNTEVIFYRYTKSSVK